MAISFKTDSGDFGSLTLTGTAPADFRSGINSSGSNYLENAYITGSDGSWIKLDNSADVWEINGSKVYYTGGNVGIGTTNPSVPLEVIGDIKGVQTTGGGARFDLTYQQVGDVTGSKIELRDSKGALPLRINSNGDSHFTGGRVGIGTDSPSSYDGESDELVVYNATNAGITIATADTTARGHLFFADGTAGSNKYAGGVDYDHNVDTLSLRAGSVSTLYISGEKVGIGTSGPSTSLNIVTSGDNDGIFLENESYRTIRLFNDGTKPIGRLALYHSGDTYLNLKSPASYASGITLGLGHTAEFINRLGEANATLAVQCSGFGHTGINVLNGAYNKRVFYVTNEGEAGLGHVDPGSGLLVTSGGNVGIGTSSPSSHSDLTLGNDGSLCLKETTTPTADANFGKLYTKSDNSLYFQDGAGTESALSLGGGSSWSSAPATATSAGAAGDRAYDSNYYYVCVATNTWKRTSLATW